jgi:site-specific DNA recombinase
MTKPRFFKAEFDRLATDGYIGALNGRLGYAYLRVSSSGQAEEGRTGLPRQIQRLHEVAAQHGIRISWELVFADDHTGFEFRDRPELSRLRSTIKQPKRKADVVVIEYLDRLSRNADWHQGFLLDEMKEYNVEVLFWKGFSSRIERAVMGAISQEGMERELQNMHQGMLIKARSGRVTTKTPNYGYVFVDAEGRQSPKVKKETYYAPHSEEAPIIQLIYQKIGTEGWSSRSLATYLEERFPAPGKYRHWEPRQISLFISNPVYKGEFIAHRWKHVKLPAKHQRPGEPVKLVTRKIQRPPEEWITVPVPPLVSPELWEAANRILEKNAQMARRNGKVMYLLTGLVRCAGCNYTYVGARKNYHRQDGDVTMSRCYRCSARYNRVPALRDEINCIQMPVNADILENAVWVSVCQALLEPELLLAQLDEELNSGETANLEQQATFIRRQIRESGDEDEKLYRAYLADVFDEQEFRARREQIKVRNQLLESELRKLQERQVTKEQIEADKTLIRTVASQMRASGVAIDAPFELRQRIIRMVVDKIVLDVAEQRFELQGQISGNFSMETGESIVSTPADRGSLPPQGSTRRGRLVCLRRG